MVRFTEVRCHKRSGDYDENTWFVRLDSYIDLCGFDAALVLLLLSRIFPAQLENKRVASITMTKFALLIPNALVKTLSALIPIHAVMRALFVNRNTTMSLMNTMIFYEKISD